RHTRFSRDWSSDVCSSDLLKKPAIGPTVAGVAAQAVRIGVLMFDGIGAEEGFVVALHADLGGGAFEQIGLCGLMGGVADIAVGEIGRASGRGGGERLRVRG